MNERVPAIEPPYLRRAEHKEKTKTGRPIKTADLANPTENKLASFSFQQNNDCVLAALITPQVPRRTQRLVIYYVRGSFQIVPYANHI